MRNENCDRKPKCDECGGNKPKGDLISREALKDIFEEHEDRRGDLDCDWRILIDNAPTVEPRDNFDLGYVQGLEDGRAERPQILEVKKMTKEELIEELETLRLNLHDDLAYINAKHDAIISQLAYVNNLLYRAKENDNA